MHVYDLLKLRATTTDPNEHRDSITELTINDADVSLYSMRIDIQPNDLVLVTTTRVMRVDVETPAIVNGEERLLRIDATGGASFSYASIYLDGVPQKARSLSVDFSNKGVTTATVDLAVHQPTAG